MRSKRLYIGMIFSLLILLGCRAATGPYGIAPTLQALQAETTAMFRRQQTLEAVATQVRQRPVVSLPADELQTATPTASQAPTAEPSSAWAHFDIRIHPDGGLFSGDRVSFEVIAPPGVDLSEAQVSVGFPGEESFAQANFASYGIARRHEAVLRWAWDTRGLTAGDYTLEFRVDPEGQQWKETFSLQPAAALPPGSAQIAWAEASNECCTVHYMTGTAAARDLEILLSEIDQQAQSVAQQLQVEASEDITITLLPRLLGHGGFANDEIHISYLDRDYTGGLPEMVIHHELVHVLDVYLGEGYQPSLLVEGLAVYLTGGHFKPEPLIPRAAALLDTYGDPPQPGLGWYIPLEALSDNFYYKQHEIGYLQAGALVEYMVQTWGWDAFVDFYRDIEERSRPSLSLEGALQNHFNLTLAELENRFIETLRGQPYRTDLLADIRLTVQHFDTVRRYQQALDPSAYFMTAWLLDSKEMRKLGIVADYARHPNELENVILENLLANAGEDITGGRFLQAEQVIGAANAVLDGIDSGWIDPFSASLLAADMTAVARNIQENPLWVGAASSHELGIQRMWVEAGQARAWVTVGADPHLQEVVLERTDTGAWQFLQSNAK